MCLQGETPMLSKWKLSAVLAAAAVIATSCSLGGGDTASLSDRCNSAIEDASRAFVTTLEEAYANMDTNPSTLAIENTIDEAVAECQDDDGSAVLGLLVTSVDVRASKVEDPNARIVVYSGLHGMCESLRSEKNFEPSEKVKEACGKARDIYLNDDVTPPSGSSSGSPSGSSSDSIFGEDGPAIGGVDTDLDFPSSSSSGTVAPFEVTYEVSGVGTAFVSYMRADGEYTSEDVTLPWQYKGTTSQDYVSISAFGDAPGEIACAIYKDGTQVTRQAETSAEPYVSCYKLF